MRQGAPGRHSGTVKCTDPEARHCDQSITGIAPPKTLATGIQPVALERLEEDAHGELVYALRGRAPTVRRVANFRRWNAMPFAFPICFTCRLICGSCMVGPYWLCVLPIVLVRRTTRRMGGYADWSCASCETYFIRRGATDSCMDVSYPSGTFSWPFPKSIASCEPQVYSIASALRETGGGFYLKCVYNRHGPNKDVRSDGDLQPEA